MISEIEGQLTITDYFDRALEDIDYNNCDCDVNNPIIYYCSPNNDNE